MTFWIRHLFLIACCVILPFVAALYLDTQAEIERTREAGARAAEVALGGLDAHLKLRTMRDLEATRAVGQSITEGRGSDDLFRAPTGSDARAGVERAIEQSLPPDGFGLLLDPAGVVRVSVGGSQRFAEGSSFLGHPIFTRSQLGFAFDTLWTEGRAVYLLTVAPLVRAGVANGAVLRARRIDEGWLLATGRPLEAELSLLDDQGLVVTSLSEETARELEGVAGTNDGQPVSFGRLRSPITASNAPFLPLFVDHQGSGLGYTSLSARIPNSGLSWSVAVQSGEALAQLGERQAIVFATMIASVMLAILIGLINARTFVGPLSTIESHLSEIQMGRGDVELPEVKVSRPYRRLVRLINMTVQKLPARGLAGYAGTPSLDRGDLSTADLRARTISTTPPPSDSGPVAPPTLADEQTESDAGVDLFGSGFASERSPSPEGSGSFVVQHTGTFRTIEPATAVEPAPDFPENLDRQLADAIDSMQAPSQAPAQAPQTGRPHSAAEIRGGSPRLESGDIIRGTPDVPPTPRGGDLGTAGIPLQPPPEPRPTVVSPVADDLLARTSRDDVTDPGESLASRDLTAVDVPPLPEEEGLEPSDRAHFREVYERFIELREQSGEPTSDLSYERFLKKLLKNRDVLVEKYKCRTVRFQVYAKDGKAALKATPVRSR